MKQQGNGFIIFEFLIALILFALTATCISHVYVQLCVMTWYGYQRSLLYEISVGRMLPLKKDATSLCRYSETPMYEESILTFTGGTQRSLHTVTVQWNGFQGKEHRMVVIKPLHAQKSVDERKRERDDT